MNRRNFTATSLAAVLAPMPQLALAQPPADETAGYQIAEITNGRLSTGFGGMATSQMAVDQTTLFQVASCSKTVTALAVLCLVRDGRVDLDRPANHLLRRWQLPGPRGATTTVADLMSHAAGTTVHGFAGYDPDEDMPTLLQILTGQHPANSDPVRTRRRLFRQFSYSGGGTMILQALIEDITGQDFASYTHAEVLTPIGAGKATFAIRPKAPFAHGSLENGQPLAGGFKRHPESAAAGLWASATDLAKILQSILHSLQDAPGALLPAALARRMVTPVVWQSGLGIFVSPDAVISHEGRNYGFDAVMAAELTSGTIRAAVTNRNGAIGAYARTLIPE